MTTILRPDILVQSPAGAPLAIVEIQNIRELTQEVASEIYHTRMGYGYGLQVPYFFLLTQDHGYLWATQAPLADLPYEFPLRNVVARYLPNLRPGERLRGPELSLIMEQWLNDLALGWQTAEEEPELILARLGFLAAIDHATLRVESRE